MGTESRHDSERFPALEFGFEVLLVSAIDGNHRKGIKGIMKQLLNSGSTRPTSLRAGRLRCHRHARRTKVRIERVAVHVTLIALIALDHFLWNVNAEALVLHVRYNHPSFRLGLRVRVFDGKVRFQDPSRCWLNPQDSG